MARTKKATPRRNIDGVETLTSELVEKIKQLVAAARREGRDEALAEVRNIVGVSTPASKAGDAAVRSTKSKPKKPATAKKSKAKRKNAWEGLSDEQRLARINAIRKGRGLPLRDSL